MFPQDHLSLAAVTVFDYVCSVFDEEYVIHLERRVSNGEDLFTHHYLFGCVDWRHYDAGRLHAQNMFWPEATAPEARAVLRLSDAATIRIGLLSNDLVYSFYFRVDHELPQVLVDLSSAVFGKGTHYAYLKFVLKGDCWMMHSNFERGKVYCRRRGTLRECLGVFRDSERQMEHPYQSVINSFPRVYRDATRQKRTFITMKAPTKPARRSRRGSRRAVRNVFSATVGVVRIRLMQGSLFRDKLDLTAVLTPTHLRTNRQHYGLRSFSCHLFGEEHYVFHSPECRVSFEEAQAFLLHNYPINFRAEQDFVMVRKDLIHDPCLFSHLGVRVMLIDSLDSHYYCEDAFCDKYTTLFNFAMKNGIDAIASFPFGPSDSDDAERALVRTAARAEKPLRYDIFSTDRRDLDGSFASLKGLLEEGCQPGETGDDRKSTQ